MVQSAFQFLQVNKSALPSVQYIESDERWYLVSKEDLQFEAEKDLIDNIRALIGENHFISDKMFLYDTQNLAIYGGRLEAFEEEEGNRSLVVSFGENKIPVTFTDRLIVGDCTAKTSVIPGKRLVEGNAIDVRILNIELSRTVNGSILKLVVNVLMDDATDPDYVQALLDSGNLEDCYSLDEEGASLIQLPKRGSGGLYPSLGDYAKTLKKSNVNRFSKLALPISGYNFHAVSGKDANGNAYSIKSVKLAIAPEFLPSECLISWGSGKDKTLYRLSNPKGFEIASKGKYDAPVYEAFELIHKLLEGEAVTQDKQQFAESMLKAYQEGTLGLVMKDFHPTHPNSSPVSLIHPRVLVAIFDYSAINIATVPLLPGKSEANTEEFKAPQLTAATEAPIDPGFTTVTVEEVKATTKKLKAVSPV